MGVGDAGEEGEGEGWAASGASGGHGATAGFQCPLGRSPVAASLEPLQGFSVFWAEAQLLHPWRES